MKLLRQGLAMIECRRVARLLQACLDQEIDAAQAERVARHLEACRRCGLDAETYEEIKAALARRRLDVDPAAVERLTEFGERLSADEDR